MSSAPSISDQPQAATVAYRLDPSHSSAEFHVRNFWGLMTVKGHFGRIEGTYAPLTRPAARLTIDAASLDTKNRKRDEHLRSADFFDVERHPEISFIAVAEPAGEGKLRLRGTLAIAGKEVPLELEANTRTEDADLEISAETEVDHRLLGMTWSPAGMLRGPSKLIVNARLVPDSSPDRQEANPR
jgi:polyisoprenoid-binding protein YceI